MNRVLTLSVLYLLLAFSLDWAGSEQVPAVFCLYLYHWHYKPTHDQIQLLCVCWLFNFILAQWVLTYLLNCFFHPLESFLHLEYNKYLLWSFVISFKASIRTMGKCKSLLLLQQLITVYYNDSTFTLHNVRSINCSELKKYF